MFLVLYLRIKKEPSSGFFLLTSITDHADSQSRYQYTYRQPGDPIHPVWVQAARFPEGCKHGRLECQQRYQRVSHSYISERDEDRRLHFSHLDHIDHRHRYLIESIRGNGYHYDF